MSDTKALATLAQRLESNPSSLRTILMNTVMPPKKDITVTEEMFQAFIIICNSYSLNPLTREIFAIRGKGGNLQAVVSVDGWLRIINNHPQFDGMEFEDILDNENNLISVRCNIYRKDRTRPTSVIEYMKECAMPTDTWRKWPARLLRHKSVIQCGRYAFGISDIIDPDEAIRYEQGTVIDQSPANNNALIEGEVENGPEPTINETQIKRIRGALKLIDMDEAQFCEGAVIDKLEQLAEFRFEGAMANLKAKYDKKLAMQQPTDDKPAKRPAAKKPIAKKPANKSTALNAPAKRSAAR